MFLDKHWYCERKTWLCNSLLPLSFIFQCIVRIRKKIQSKYAYKSKIFIIIVGNITIGGTGKTPLVRSICQNLKKNYNLAIISRGYKNNSKKFPLQVKPNNNYKVCGDEPLMLSKWLEDIPVIVDPIRVRAVKYIEKKP